MSGDSWSLGFTAERLVQPPNTGKEANDMYSVYLTHDSPRIRPERWLGDTFDRGRALRMAADGLDMILKNKRYARTRRKHAVEVREGEDQRVMFRVTGTAWKKQRR